jgi:hypothetical protein
MTPVVLTAATVGFAVLQVIGGSVRVRPAVSFTVAVMVCAGLPFKNVRELPPVEVARLIDATGQAVNVTGVLVAPAAVAERGVLPGVFAVART